MSARQIVLFALAFFMFGATAAMTVVLYVIEDWDEGWTLVASLALSGGMFLLLSTERD